MRTSMLVLCLLAILLVACGGDSDGESEETRRLFDWDKSAEFVLFRIDSIEESDPETLISNTIPPCTLYGNGRLIFTNDVNTSQQILESRLSEDQVRAFVEDVIGYGFYGWEDDILPQAAVSDLNLKSISLNLYAELRTVERYSEFPVDGYERLLEDCRNLSEQRALVLPLQGGWVRAIPVNDFSSNNTIPWPNNAPFTLRDVANSGSPYWVEPGQYANYLWDISLSDNLMTVIEGSGAYHITFQVPGISRTAPPVPVTD